MYYIWCTQTRILILYVTLFSVTLLAEHLKIVYGCLSALAPRNDMVSLHFIYFVMFATDRANTILPFVCSSLVLVGELTD